MKFFIGIFAVFIGFGALLFYEFAVDVAPPHRFVVNLDEPADRVTLTLGNSTDEISTNMQGKGMKFRGSRDVSDSSGKILVKYEDGSELECSIDYITNGEQEPHRVNISNRICPEIGSHVQNF